MYLEGGKEQPVTACFHVPNQWKLACGLDSPPKNLNDAVPKCESVEPKYLVMDFDIDGFVNMVKKICAYQIELMNDVPFTKYVFSGRKTR